MPENSENVIPTAGMEDDVPLLKGLDGVLKSQQAASQAIKDAATELKVIAERTGKYGTGGAAAREFASGVVGSIEKEALYNQIVTAGGDPAAAAQFAGIPKKQPEPEEAPPTAVVASTATTSTASPDRSNQETFEYYRDYLGGERGFSLRNLRKDLGKRIVDKTSQSWGEQLFQGEDGQWVDESGNIASNAALMAFMRREKIAGAAQGFGQSLAKGQTMRSAGMGAMPGVVAKGAGIAGAALFAGQQAGDFFEGQRAANAEWQAMFGGTNLGATGERFRQKMFGLSQFGFMDSDQAERLYMDVSRLGLRDDERQTSLDFATSMYSELGMSVQQSMKLIQLASETGQTSLQGVAVALREVSESAVEAGMNAERAREMFINTLSGATGVAGGGVGTTQTSAILASAQASLGREYEGIDFGFFDQDQITRMAAETGQEFNQVALQVSQDPLGYANQWVQMRQQDVKSAFKSPAHYEEAKRIVTEMERNGASPNEMAQAIYPYLIRLDGVQQILLGLTNTRVNSLNEAALAIVPFLTGGFDPAAEAADLKAQGEIRQVFDPNDQGQEMGFGGATVAAAHLNRDKILEEMEGVHEDRGVLGLGIDWLGADSDTTRIKRAYEDYIEETGQAGGIIGMIAKDAGAQAAIENVKVGDEVMTLAEAIRKHPEKVQEGEVQVEGGDYHGQSLDEVVGMGFAGEGAGGNVVLGLTPEARRILQPYQVSGSVSYDDYYQPTDPDVVPGARPSGNP